MTIDEERLPKFLREPREDYAVQHFIDWTKVFLATAFVYCLSVVGYILIASPI